MIEIIDYADEVLLTWSPSLRIAGKDRCYDWKQRLPKQLWYVLPEWLEERI